MFKPSSSPSASREGSEKLLADISAPLQELVAISIELTPEGDMPSQRRLWSNIIETLVKQVEARLPPTQLESTRYKASKETLLKMETEFFEVLLTSDLKNRPDEFKLFVKNWTERCLRDYVILFDEHLESRVNRLRRVESFAYGALLMAVLAGGVHYATKEEPQKIPVPVEVEPKPLFDPRDIPELIRLFRQLIPGIY